MQFLSVFLDITKIADFWQKSGDVNRTQKVDHVIYMFLGFPVGKV